MGDVTITLAFSEEQMQEIGEVADQLGVSAAEFVRAAALDCLEDQLDLAAWEDAKLEFDADPQTLSAAEVAAKHL